MSHDVDLSPNPAASVTRLKVGAEGLPVLIIDDALARPDALCAYARQASFVLEESSGNHFPGVRAPLTDDYPRAIEALIRPHLDHFGLNGAHVCDVPLNTLQMVTKPAQQLIIPQCIPHFDTLAGMQIAVVHYLSESDKGGTDFYRHRSSGFERITEDRFHPYTQKLVSEVQARGLPKAYMKGSTDLFERIGNADSRFNRLAVYFSNMLHSGHIEGEGPFPDTVDEGRLTASVFLRFEKSPENDGKA